MSIPATIPLTSPTARSRPWSPSDRDRLIFQWVKFEGHTQSWVAEQLEMSQSTVSRIIERYEKWIAHGGPAHSGGLSHGERLRAQRWMTYERNEWILTSALRIAGEMERVLDTSKSTISRPVSQPSKESEIRTEHKVIDRSGIAARFLRLAHRVNMDQLKLVEQDPLPALEPLRIDEVEDAESVTHWERVARAPTRSVGRRPGEGLREPGDEHAGAAITAGAEPEDSITAGEIESPPAVAPMQCVHDDDVAETPSTDDATATCAEIAASENSLTDAYAVVAIPPERTDTHPSLAARTITCPDH